MKCRLVSILISLVFFVSCKRHLVRTEEKAQHYPLATFSGTNSVNDSIQRFKRKVDAETSRVIAFSEEPLTKQGDESSLGNFVCDALFRGAVLSYSIEPDIVLVNRGGLRTEVPKGEFRVLNIFELMPFENELVVIHLKGEDVLKMTEKIWEKKHAFRGMILNKEKKNEILIGGKLLDQQKEYSIATSDYLVEGGDGFTMFKGARAEKRAGKKIRDVIVNYCEEETSQKRNIKSYTNGKYK